MKAVKSGYSFNLFSEEELSGRELEKTNSRVKVDGAEYALYRGKTYAASQEIDHLLDLYGERKTREFLVKEMER